MEMVLSGTFTKLVTKAVIPGLSLIGAAAGPQLRHRLGGPPVGDDWNTWLGIPDEDAVLSQDGHQDPVPVGGHPDGVRATLLWEGQHARPSYRVVHQYLSAIQIFKLCEYSSSPASS